MDMVAGRHRGMRGGAIKFFQQQWAFKGSVAV